MRPRQLPLTDLASRPATFSVGDHTLVLTKVAPSGRWTVDVDGSRTEQTFESEVDAWEEGVRTADRIDRGTPAPVR